MPSSQRIGGIRADITAKDSGFLAASKRTAAEWKKQRAQMKRTQARVRALNRTFRSLKGSLVGLATGAGFAALAQATAASAKETANYGSSLVEVSKRIGTTVEDLQVLRRVFEGDGVAAQKFDQIMSALVRRFSANSPTLQKAIQKVGISLDDWYATGGDIAKLLPLLARGMENAKSQADRLNLAQEAFSSSGRAAAVILQQGAEALHENSELMRALGIVTQEEAQRLKDFGQELANLRTKELTAQAKAIANNTETYLAHATAVSELKTKFAEFVVSLAGATKVIADAFGFLAEKILMMRAEMSATFSWVARVGSAVATFLNADVLDAVSAWKALTAEIKAAGEEYDHIIDSYFRAAEGAAGGAPPPPPTPSAPAARVGPLEHSGLNERMRGRFDQPPTGSAAAGAEALDAALAKAKETDDLIEQSRIEMYQAIGEAAVKQQQETFAIMDEIQRKQNEVAEATEMAWQKLNESITRNAGDALGEFVNGTKSAKEALASFVQSAIKQLTSTAFTNALANLQGGGGGGGGLFGAIGKLFGRERGGPVSAGRGYIVGEKRAEVFVPERDGFIFPSLAAAGMGGGGVFAPVFNFAAGVDRAGVRAEIQRALPIMVEAASEANRSRMMSDLGRPSTLSDRVRRG